MGSEVHLLQFSLVVYLFFSVVLDVVEGEDVVVLVDAGCWLFRVDVL